MPRISRLVMDKAVPIQEANEETKSGYRRVSQRRTRSTSKHGGPGSSKVMAKPSICDNSVDSPEYSPNSDARDTSIETKSCSSSARKPRGRKSRKNEESEEISTKNIKKELQQNYDYEELNRLECHFSKKESIARSSSSPPLKPNKIIKAEVEPTQFRYPYCSSRSSRRTTSKSNSSLKSDSKGESNSFTTFDPNEIIQEKVIEPSKSRKMTPALNTESIMDSKKIIKNKMAETGIHFSGYSKMTPVKDLSHKCLQAATAATPISGPGYRKMNPVLNSDFKFDSEEIVKKERFETEIPIQRGLKSWKNAAPGYGKMTSVLKSDSMFNSKKIVKKEEVETEIPIQRGLKSWKNAAPGYGKMTQVLKSDSMFNSKKIVKKEEPWTEIPIQREPKSGKNAAPGYGKMTPVLNSDAIFDWEEFVKKEVVDTEIPVPAYRKMTPVLNSDSVFDLTKCVKKEEVDTEIPIHRGLKIWNNAATGYGKMTPVMNSDSLFDSKKIVKKEVVDTEIPIRGYRKMTPGKVFSKKWVKATTAATPIPIITVLNSDSVFDSTKIVKKEVIESSKSRKETPGQDVLSPWLGPQPEYPVLDLSIAFDTFNDPYKIIKKEREFLSRQIDQNTIIHEEEQPYSTAIDPNIVVKREKRASDLPLLVDSAIDNEQTNSDFLTNLFQLPSEVAGIDSLALKEEQNLDWLIDSSSPGNVEPSPACHWLDAEFGSGYAPSEEIQSQVQVPTRSRDLLRQAEENNVFCFKKSPDDSVASYSGFEWNQQDNGLAFDAVYDHYTQFGTQEQDDIDARLGAELASLFSVEEPMPECRPKTLDDATTLGKAKNTEAEIDARLQAELDALPMVLAPEGVNEFLDNLLKPDQRAPPARKQNLAITKPHTGETFSTVDKINSGTVQVPQPVQAAQHPLSQVPKVAQLTGLQGQVVSLTYTTAPDGLVTSVSTSSTEVPLAQPESQASQLESLTANQLHKILQSGQPYLGRPMMAPGCPGAGELGPTDADGIISPTGQAVEDEEVDYEEIGVADTYAEYWPSKLKFGTGHPDPVVETATLSSVELPDINYQLALPPKSIACLSALQLEAVVYACQAHEQILPSGERAGFLLGDGAGVGKGRTIAGIIFDNYMNGRKRAVWVSVSNDLRFDAERDLYDIGANEKVPVVAINKFKYSRIDSDENENFQKGVIFCTYTALIGESLTCNSKYKTRLRQLYHWLGKKFDGVIVFDECHKAKNLSLMNVGKSTKTGTTVLELQKLLPYARVVYASATGASEPRNMAYMIRLGLWGPGTAYTEFFEFVNAVEKRGIGAMEIVAMDMKLRGTYIARQLSFKDVTFRIEEVVMPRDFRKTYNLAAELWAEINKKFVKACRLMCIENRVQKIITCQFWCAHQRFFKNLCIASKVNHVVRMTRQATRLGKAVVIGLQSTGESRTLEHLERHNGRLSSFVSTSKMIIQSFVEKHFPAPKRDSFHRLLNTGEFEPETRHRPPRSKRAKMSSDCFDDDMDAEAGESDIEMYESTVDDERIKSGRKRRGRPPKVEKVEKITMQERILQHLCNNMRAQDNDGDAYTFDSTKPQKANITENDVERCIRARELLLDKIEILGRRLPSNTLDKLISELGGTKLVAEMTGRRGRVVRSELDGYKYEPRCESDTTMDLVNYREKQRFMAGSKHVAIISEAASSGISLQSDKRVSNQRRRLHITLELPWSADRAIQQFGRTHRSNQVNSPEYVFVITDLAGERRFASTVAKRLESLGALTQGDRRATDARDLSQFNIDNSIGRSALENVMQQLTGEKPLDHSKVPTSYKGHFLYDCSVAMAGVGMLNVREENKVKMFSVEKDSNNISKFLNRILGCRVEVQNALFKFFLDKMHSLIMQMKRKGNFDLGIVDLDAHGACVRSVKLMRFIRNHATGTAATELHTVTAERGMSFETAMTKYRKESRHDHEGFYLLQHPRQSKNSAILCLQAKASAPEGAKSAPNKISLQLYRPNTGPQVRLETLSSILARFVKVEPEAARDFWQQQFDVCLDKCSHVYWNSACPYPSGCEVGLRVRPYHVLSGLMLPIWDRIELILEKKGHKIQIIRVKTDVNKKIVGTVVPHAVYDALVADLSSDSIVESH